jgi:hypothetical protein
MGEELKWVKGSAVREVDGRPLYSFTASRAAVFMNVTTTRLRHPSRLPSQARLPYLLDATRTPPNAGRRRQRPE